MITESEVQEMFVGKTIVSVETDVDDGGGVTGMLFTFSDGSKQEISCTSYNYGQQHLVFD